MAKTKVKTRGLTDLNVTNAKIAAGTIDVTAKITGTVPTGNLGSGTASSSTILYGDQTYKAEPTTDLTGIYSDLTALAIREATNEASAAFNLPHSFIETFTDDTNLGTQTTGDRVGGYWASATLGSFAYATGDQTSNYTVTTNGTWEVSPATILIDGTEDSSGGNVTLLASTSQSAGTYIRFDRGSGNTFVANGLKMIRQAGHVQAGGSDWKWQGSQDASDWTDLLTGQDWGGASPTEYTWTNTTGYRYYQFIQDDAFTSNNNVYEYEWQFSVATLTVNATATLIQSANAVTGSRTKVGGTFLYKDNAGTATLGTDLIIYFTCDGGSNWTEAASYTAITPVYSSGVKQVKLGETTCTGGTDVRYKAVWANQSGGSKETQLHAIGINY